MLLRTRSLTFKNMPRAAIPISLVPLSWYLPKSVAQNIQNFKILSSTGILKCNNRPTPQSIHSPNKYANWSFFTNKNLFYLNYTKLK
jgi:hypothetical protein